MENLSKSAVFESSSAKKEKQRVDNKLSVHDLPENHFQYDSQLLGIDSNQPSSPVQKKAESKEEELQMKKESVPKQSKEEDEKKTQLKPGDAYPHLTASKAIQTKMPEQVQAKMEQSFGTDFSSVNIHKDSSSATQMGAQAYAQGNDVHFAPGKYNPNTQGGQELLGHELTHVVQQRQGRVSGAQNKDGANINADPSLENEADEMGRKAAKGEKTSLSSGGSIHNSNALQAKAVIQRSVATSGGDWDTNKYDLITPATANGLRGVDMDIKFKPNNNVDAELIGIVQTIKFRKSGTPYYMGSATREDHSIESGDAINTGNGTDEGTHIDQFDDETNPLYAVTGSKASDTSLTDTAPGATWGQHGYRYKDNTNTLKTKDATLKDEPKIHTASKNSSQIFETTALALKGNQKDAYYGSVKWGWTTDNSGTFKKVPLQVSSMGTPTSSFMKAAEIWNKSKTGKGKDTLDLPTQDVKLVKNILGVKIGLGPVFTQIPFGTRVVETGFASMTKVNIKVVDGPYVGMTGQVDVADLMDERS